MSTWINWYQLEWGFRLNNGDIIKITSLERGEPDAIEFVLISAPIITWWKGISIVDTPVGFGLAWTKNQNHGPSSLKIPLIPQVLQTAALEFQKAATLGITTGFYKVGDLMRYSGMKVTLTWFWDWGANESSGNIPPSPSQPVSLVKEYFRLTPKHSSKCLDVTGGPSAIGNGSQVQQWDYWGGENQQWKYIPAGDGWYKIIAKHSGKCLDVIGGPSATGNGAQVQQWDYWGGDNQQWRFESVGDNSYKIIAKHSGKCLDVIGGPSAMGNGAQVQQWDYWGGNNQKWRVE